MRFLSNLTRRERTIVYVTVATVVGVVVYFGYLDGFIDRYQTVSANLAAQTESLRQQESVLKEGPKVDAEFAAIEGSLPKPQEAGKDSAMVFSEQMEDLFKNLGLPTPDFGNSRKADIPNVKGFSYQILPILRVQGNLATLTNLLKSLAQRNLKIWSLKIHVTGSPQDRLLEFNVEPAQVIRNDQAGKAKSEPKPAVAKPSNEEL